MLTRIWVWAEKTRAHRKILTPSKSNFEIDSTFYLKKSATLQYHMILHWEINWLSQI